MYVLLMLSAIALILLPMLLFKKKVLPVKYLQGVSLIKIAAIFVLCTVVMATGFAGEADASPEPDVAGAAGAGLATGIGYLAAALSTGMACIGAGIAVAASASAAIGASAENPAMMGRVLIFVAMGEGVTLFGLLVSIMILGRL